MANSSMAVVEAISEAKQCDPIELPPLYNSIDPDSLGSLVNAFTGEVTFGYAGYAVTIDGDGDVSVEPEGE